MAGTVPSLSLSTQFDKNGQLLRSGKVYWYQANTLIPQLAYSDSGLTLALANPYTLDGSARVPEFYCADGSIRVRVVDKNGVVQIDAKNVLVIGPSSGGGGGGSVDATAIFQTGDTIWLDQAGLRSGWVRDNGRTIGSATSGATERANADCLLLFTFLWATYSDTVCPVSGGRGANAAADWAANKQITLPDKRGYMPGGLSDMGSTDSGRLASVPIVQGTVTTPGSQIGEALNTLDTTKIPAHTHAATVGGPSLARSGSPVTINPGVSANVYGDLGTGVPTVTNANTGGGGAHNNTPLTVLGTFYRKL